MIEAYRNAGKNISAIAGYADKAKSVISWELIRNSHERNGSYKADLALRKATGIHHSKPKARRLKV